MSVVVSLQCSASIPRAGDLVSCQRGTQDVDQLAMYEFNNRILLDAMAWLHSWSG